MLIFTPSSRITSEKSAVNPELLLFLIDVMYITSPGTSRVILTEAGVLENATGKRIPVVSTFVGTFKVKDC